MVKVIGILEDGLIRLRGPIDLPSGIEVEITIRPRSEDLEIQRRRAAAQAILSRPPVKIAPLNVVDLVREDRASH